MRIAIVLIGLLGNYFVENWRRRDGIRWPELWYTKTCESFWVSSSPLFPLWVALAESFLSNSLSSLTFLVANQYFEAEVLSEYIIKGNAALIKCNIPSFVSDFARVEAWLGSDGQEFKYNGVNMDYGKGTCQTISKLISYLRSFFLN